MVVGSIELLPGPDAVGLLAEYGDVYPDAPAVEWAPYRTLYPEVVSGELRVALADLGVRPGDVAIVFLPHLHIDHVGRNADLEGVALFPRARYVVHRDSLAFARRQDGRAHVQRCIIELDDRFETIDGDVELAAGVNAFVSAGRYAGYMGLPLDSEESGEWDRAGCHA